MFEVDWKNPTREEYAAWNARAMAVLATLKIRTGTAIKIGNTYHTNLIFVHGTKELKSQSFKAKWLILKPTWAPGEFGNGLALLLSDIMGELPEKHHDKYRISDLIWRRYLTFVKDDVMPHAERLHAEYKALWSALDQNVLKAEYEKRSAKNNVNSKKRLEKGRPEGTKLLIDKVSDAIVLAGLEDDYERTKAMMTVAIDLKIINSIKEFRGACHAKIKYITPEIIEEAFLLSAAKRAMKD